MTVIPLTKSEQNKLLRRRLDGQMGLPFKAFANMFIVKSNLQGLGYTVGLMADSKTIADADLTSPFPEFYKPRLDEFLDAIALQTKSQWKYDPTDKYVRSDAPDSKPIDHIAVFEFREQKARPKPYHVKLAEGWKAEDKGSWTMYVPPSFPVGMDIYEMGTYSHNKKEKETELFERVRSEVALEWAQRVHEGAKAKDLKPSHVGSYEAVYFEAMIPSQLGKDIRWRQWVFMVDHRCYFIVSTILPEFDETIYPDVLAMIKSFGDEP